MWEIKKKKKKSLPFLRLGEGARQGGRRPGPHAELEPEPGARARRPPARSAAADWALRPEAQPIRCLGSWAIHESGGGEEAGGGERG